MRRYIVTAGYVTAQTAVKGGRAEVDIPCGAYLPDDVPAEQRDRFVALGQVVVLDEPAPATEDTEVRRVESVPEGSVAAVLEWVGDDLERAATALEIEQNKAEPPRTTLVTALTKLLEQQA